MRALTPSERRGAATVALLFALGAARDLWVAAHPEPTPAPRMNEVSAPAAAPLPEAAPGGASDPAARATEAGARRATLLDLNRADEVQLDALPGIGPVLAGRIVAHRSRFGPFARPEDLLAVPGVGPRLLERLRPLVTVGPPEPAPAR